MSRVLKNWVTHNDPSKYETTFSATFNNDSVLDAMDDALYRDIKEQLAKRYVEENYNELVKLIDKEAIVKQVALQVSENILAIMFGEKK